MIKSFTNLLPSIYFQRRPVEIWGALLYTGGNREGSCMLIYNEFISNYWNYYLILEERVISSFRYVELNENNFKTYSIEFLSLLLSIGSEVDVAFKEVLNISNDNKSGIKKYLNGVSQNHPEIIEIEVKTITGNIKFKPFMTDKSGTLQWWKIYNSLKHNRTEKYQDATLQYVLYALGGLFALEMYHFKQMYLANKESPDMPEPASKLFYIPNWDTKYLSVKRLMEKIINPTM